MTKRNRFILIGIAIALGFFPIWRFALQGTYLNLLGWIVAKLGGVLPYGTAALSQRIAPKAGEIAFDLFDKRQTVVVEVSSIVTNVVPLMALIFATPVELKKRIFGAVIGLAIAFGLHVFATSVILWWQAMNDTGAIEGLKIFTDGVLIAAFPLLYWSVWADTVFDGGMKKLFSK
ncbi:MAG TPA: hypothetical protein ENN75_02155 [candidate division Zixibacteria bacterium]|nr:hypothetical protein [candidate division Zixibacteria bacterium]